MHSSHTQILGFLGAIAIPAVAHNGPYLFLGAGIPVSIQRLDPVISPGKVSGHVRSIVGGNAFAPTLDFDATQKATCSTIRVAADKSNYWMPALYFHAKNGSFIRVPEKPDHRIYYKFGNGENTPDKERSEFPPGFRRISGSANLRHDDGSMVRWVLEATSLTGSAMMAETTESHRLPQRIHKLRQLWLCCLNEVPVMEVISVS